MHTKHSAHRAQAKLATMRPHERVLCLHPLAKLLQDPRIVFARRKFGCVRIPSHRTSRSLSAIRCPCFPGWSPYPSRITFPGTLPSNRFHGLRRYYGSSDFCRLLTQPTDLPAYCAQPSLRSVRNHPMASQHRLIHHAQRPALLLDFIVNSDNSSRHETESGSSSYGPQLRLRLLSTPPRGDAVTFSYEVVADLDGGFHPAD